MPGGSAVTVVNSVRLDMMRNDRVSDAGSIAYRVMTTMIELSKKDVDLEEQLLIRDVTVEKCCG